ncbi:MAG: hypothetical protein HFI15_07230 [Lachnospiraceae bacterium]|nr:hypothetical protein [Lachnospiraceae bacterium]
MNKQEELLAQVLEECLEEDLSFVPPEGEIARKHRFSEDFEKFMQELLTEASRRSRKREIKKHFSPRFGQWAACILVFCVCGGLFYYVSGRIGGSGMGTKSDTSEAPAVESAADETLDTGAAEGGQGASPEEAEPESAASEDVPPELNSREESAGQQGRDYCGRVVYPAEVQEVPEELENVTTRVNCPVLDEDDPVLMLSIGNTGETDISYFNRYDLEVWLGDAWYRIPEGSEEAGEWLTLEAGMAVDEEIDLSSYEIDHDASQYRLVTHVDQGVICAEFTFEEVFQRTMEE